MTIGGNLARLLHKDGQRVCGISDVRGRGLLIGIECSEPARARDACARALARGVIVLPSGDRGEVVSITPPLSIEPTALENALEIVAEALLG